MLTIRSFIIIILLALPSQAIAKAVTSGWRVEPVSLRIIANDEKHIGVEQTIHPNDEIIRAAIGIASAAEMLEDINIRIAGEQWFSPKGAVFARINVLNSPEGAVINPQRTFCGQLSPVLANDRSIKPTTPFCFTDVNQDGKFDHVFTGRNKTPDDAVVQPIIPVSYIYQENVPLPGSYIKIIFYTPPKSAFDFNGRQLIAVVTFRGQELTSLENVTTRVMGKRKSFKAYQTVAGKIYPKIIEFGAVRISILSFQKETNEIRLRVDHGFNTVDLVSVYG